MQLHGIINETTLQMKPDVIQHLMTPAVVALDKAVTDAGFELRIVGGAVRDLVQGKDPKDIDMASDARPEQMMDLLDKVGIRHEPTGLEHGTITVILDGEPIEITTLRIDTDQDGRHATVQFTNDWRKDAERRDLTFNAMSMEMDGTLHDFFDGVEDINNGVARFVGDADARMQEDFLRILRFFRFQGRLNSPTWDKETMHAIKRNADGLEGVSGERIWAEMEKILSQPSRLDVLRRMNGTNVLDSIGILNDRIDTVNKVSGNDPVVALSALLGSESVLETLRKRWKFSNEVNDTLQFILGNRRFFIDETKAQRMLADPKIKTAHVMALLEAKSQGALAEKLKQWTPPEFPVNGSDLLAAGVAAGPEMGRKLAQLRDEWEQSGFELDKTQLLKEL